MRESSHVGRKGNQVKKRKGRTRERKRQGLTELCGEGINGKGEDWSDRKRLRINLGKKNSYKVLGIRFPRLAEGKVTLQGGRGGAEG